MVGYGLFRVVSSTVPYLFGAALLAWIACELSAGDGGGEGAESSLLAGPFLERRVTRIYATASLVEYARTARMQCHDLLAADLEAHGLRNAWYAVTTAYPRSLGSEALMTVSCRPFDSPSRIQEIQSVLHTLAGRPPLHHVFRYSEATVEIVPESWLDGDPDQRLDQRVEADRRARQPGW